MSDPDPRPPASEEIVLLAQLSVAPGRSEEFGAAVRRLTAFVEEAEPALARYEFFLSADGRTGRAIHIYRDSAALDFHLDVSSGVIAEVLEHATMSGLELLGDPTPDVVDKAGAYWGVGVARRVSGFVRSP